MLDLLFLLVLIAFFFLISLFYKQISLKLPPGPWKLPLVGNLHQVALSTAPPHQSLRDLSKKHGPIMSLQLGKVLVVVISSSEAAKMVLNTHELLFAQRPVTLTVEAIALDHRGIVSAPYGEFWRKIRKICVAKLLIPNSVKSFGLVREKEVSSLVESVSSSKQDPVNITKLAVSMTSAVISRAVFGKRCRRQDELGSWLKCLFALNAGFALPDCFPSLKNLLSFMIGLKGKLERIRKKLYMIVDEMIIDHEMKGKSKSSCRIAEFGDNDQEDLVEELLKLSEDSGDLKVTRNHVKLILLEMLAAGSETTANTIEWAMSELLKNPRTLEKAQAEVRKIVGQNAKIKDADIQKMDYLKCVIKETLRLHCPAPLIGRESRERCEILGYEIPKKTIVVINAWAIGRDPEIWDFVDCFMPERFIGRSVDFKGTEFGFFPFGGGRRMCPGILFALASVELALAHLLYHFEWGLPNGARVEELDMSEGVGATCWRRNELCLVASPHVAPFTN